MVNKGCTQRCEEAEVAGGRSVGEGVTLWNTLRTQFAAEESGSQTLLAQ